MRGIIPDFPEKEAASMGENTTPTAGRAWLRLTTWCVMMCCMTNSGFAGEKQAVPDCARAVRVVLPEKPNDLLERIVAVFARQVEKRCPAKVATQGDAPLTVALSLDPAIGKEGFRIRDRAGGGIDVIGQDERGVLYGLGKLLRTSRYSKEGFAPGAWRGESIPQKEVRGIYFATHFHNFYHDGPIEQIQRYVEDLALWGCNNLMVWYDMHHFKGFNDPEAVAFRARLHAILSAAKQVGIHVSLVLPGNEAYGNSPAELRRTPGAGRGGDYPCAACPSKPDGLEYILKVIGEEFDWAADLQPWSVCIWPFDQGGCGCTECQPWATKGFLKCAKPIARMAREKLPGVKIILSNWYYKQHEKTALGKMLSAEPAWIDFVMGPVPGASIPAVNFPEISMLGVQPWGGYGAIPVPHHLQKNYASMAQLQGGWPYSEGLFEDMNKAMMLQLYWNPQQPVVETLAEYAGFEFAPEAAADVVSIVKTLEGNFRRRRNIGADAVTAYELAQKVDATLPAKVRTSWRWRILYLRALIDKEMRLTKGALKGKVLKDAFDELRQIYHADNALQGWLRPPVVKGGKAKPGKPADPGMDLDPVAGAAEKQEPRKTADQVMNIGSGELAVVLGATPSPAEKRVSELLAERIKDRTGIELAPSGGKARYRLLVGTIASNDAIRAFAAARKEIAKLGPDGYCITADTDRRELYVIGQSDSGVVAGVGRLMREMRYEEGRLGIPALKVCETPQMPNRGIYLWARKHYFNHPDRVDRYIEELALWGCNAVNLWFEMGLFKSFDDTEMQAEKTGFHDSHRNRLSPQQWLALYRRFYKTARRMGMKTGLGMCANDAYRTSPEALRIRPIIGCPNWYMCPSKPGAVQQMVAWQEEVFKALAPIDIYNIFPADAGGCSCKDCTPWPTQGLWKVAKPLGERIHKISPKTEIWLDTWHLNHPTFGGKDWKNLVANLAKEAPAWMTGFEVGLAPHHKYAKMSAEDRKYYNQAKQPLTVFTEISMFRNHPGMLVKKDYWKSLQDELNDYDPKLMKGGWLYAERWNTDIAMTLFNSWYWNPRKPVEAVLDDYAAFYFGPEAKTGRALLDLLDDGCRDPQRKQKIRQTFEKLESAVPDWVKKDWRWDEIKLNCSRFRVTK